MIENYIDLLIAIFNSDYKIKNEIDYPIIVYDTKNNDLPIGVFKNAESCARYFNTTQSSIKTSVCRNHLRYCRFRLERVK